MSFAAEFNTQSLGAVVAVIATLLVIVYFLVNFLRAGKRELGSEIELAPNRKPYLSDEELEGPKIIRGQLWAFVMLISISIGLPLYWVLEPGRQSNAAIDFNAKFIHEGEEMFAAAGENPHALGCAGCHGPEGVGGSTTYNLIGPDGSVQVVNWKAPALNTVLLRYSRQEVTFILDYGRPFSPMQAWGTKGGGPLDDQQVQNLVDYLESIQLTSEEAQQNARDGLEKMKALKNPDGTPVYASEGEALFNMGLGADIAGGSYACARCHTQGWSYAESYPEVKDKSGCGALGPSLCGGSVEEQFPAEPSPEGCVPPTTAGATTTTSVPSGQTTTSVAAQPECINPFQDQLDFVSEGSENGTRYGVHGQGSGKMPGFGTRPEEPALFWINKGKPRDTGPGMLPPDLIEKIVEYERSL